MVASLRWRTPIVAAARRGPPPASRRRPATESTAHQEWTGHPNADELREQLEDGPSSEPIQSTSTLAASAANPGPKTPGYARAAAGPTRAARDGEEPGTGSRSRGERKSMKEELQALGFSPVDEGQTLTDGTAISLLTTARVYQPAPAVTQPAARSSRRAGLSLLQSALQEAAPKSMSPTSTITYSPLGLDPEVNREEGKDNIIPHLEACVTPANLSQLLDQIFPRWASNGYRLLCVSSGACIPAPTPAEAAHALKVIAQSAKKVKMNKFDTLELARDRLVLGLVEALRVTPPRTTDPDGLPEALQAPGSYWVHDGAAQEIDDLIDADWLTRQSDEGVGTSSGSEEDAHVGLTRISDPRGSNMLEEPTLVERLLSHTRASTSTSTQNSPSCSSDTAAVNVSSLLSKYQAASKQATAPATSNARTQNSIPGAPHPPAGSSPSTGSQDGVVFPVDLSASLELPETSLPQELGREFGHKLGPDAFHVPADPQQVQQVHSMQSEFGDRDQIKHVAFSWALWGLSVLGGATAFSEEMEALLKLARWKTWPFQTYELSNIVWALANARHWSPVLPALEARILAHGGISKFKPPETASLLWGFARLGYVPIRLLDTIHVGWGYRKSSKKATQSGKARGNVSQFTPGQLTSIAWAMAVMQQTHRPGFREIWREICRRHTSIVRNPQYLTQVWQASLAARVDGTWDALCTDTAALDSTLSSLNSVSPVRTPKTTTDRRVAGVKIMYVGDRGDAKSLEVQSGVPANVGTRAAGGEAMRKLLAAAEVAFKQETSGLQRKVQSQYQRQLADALSDIGLVHVVEDDSSGYAIDVTVPALRVAIEADGPSHSARTDPKHLLGHTLMKRRHLKALGWHFISVPHWEWDQLPNQLARINYLEQRMDEVLPEETRRSWVKKWSARPVPLDF